MDPWLALLALSPIVVVFLLLTLRRMAADLAGVVGWVVTLAVAGAFFHTPLQTSLLAPASGVLASLPVALVVATSIWQVTLMQQTGAIARVVALLKTVAPRDPVVQILIVNVGAGTLLAALGSTPVSILPPIMLALGYSSFVAIALPAIGYDALCTYALLGTPVVVFANLVGQPVQEVGGWFARFMPVVSTCIALGMLWIVGRWKMVRQGFLPTVVAGVTAGATANGMNALGVVTLTGVAAGLAVILVMLAYLGIVRRPLRDRASLGPADLDAERRLPLWKALSPWWILTLFSLVVNAPFLPFFDWAFKRVAMPVEVIPGAPERLRLLWQAYTWILVSTVLAIPFLRPTRGQLAASVKTWAKRAPRPVLAAAVFFAIAYAINHSGKGLDWTLADPSHNMVRVLAGVAADGLGRLYVLAAPFLGLLGGFVSGSEASSLAMLTALHLDAARRIGAVGLLVAAASGIGGGLASVISPAKLQNAAASIDRIGEESRVIGTAFVISLSITLVAALMSLLWAFA